MNPARPWFWQRQRPETFHIEVVMTYQDEHTANANNEQERDFNWGSIMSAAALLLLIMAFIR
jgi:hypothetical protein